MVARSIVILLAIVTLHEVYLPNATISYSEYWFRVTTPLFSAPIGVKVPDKFGLRGKTVLLMGQCISCDNELVQRINSMARESSLPILVLSSDPKQYKDILERTQCRDCHIIDICKSAYALSNGQRAFIGQDSRIERIEQ